MSLAVAIQMDPIQHINYDGDSTFVLGLAAQDRGHRLYHYHPNRLSLRDGKATARGHAMTLARSITSSAPRVK